MTTEEQLMSLDEREQVNFMWNLLPEEDKKTLTQNDILFVLDAMDDFLENEGLLEVDRATGEVTYLDGEVDETEQLEFVKKAVQDANRNLSGAQIQLIMDAELQYGIKQGYYED